MSLHTDMVAFRAEQPNGLSAEELTELFYPRTTKAALRELLTMEFWRIERDEIRTYEVRAVAKMASGPQPVRRERVKSHEADLETLRDLLDRPYRTRGSEERLLRYMTREEHQARLDMLLAHRAGVERSIELHREAIRLIEATGVGCLDELDRADRGAVAA